MKSVMLSYPVELFDDEGTVMVTFPDIPGARTYGEDDAEALANAIDALETMIAAMISDREEIPAPSRASGRPLVSPTLLGSLKIAVYQAMRARGWRKADLARALRVNPRQIDRLLDLRHATPVEQLEAAFAACGRRVVLETEAA